MVISLIINLIALVVVFLLFVLANIKIYSERKKTAVVVFGLQETIRAASDAIEKQEEELRQARSYASSLLEDKLELSEKNEELLEELKIKDGKIALQSVILEMQHKSIMNLLKEMEQRRDDSEAAPADGQNDISEADEPVDADKVEVAPEASASEEKA